MLTRTKNKLGKLNKVNEVSKLTIGKIITMSAGKAFRRSDVELGIESPQDAYLITFSKRLVEYAEERGWNYAPELAPSSFLFGQMQEFKKNDDYDKPKIFEEFYKPRFIEQLESPFAMEKLEEIAFKVSQGKNILLVCFCGDETYCHRSIIKNIIETALTQY